MSADTTPASDRPADLLRAAAEKLREAASHATPGPWRTHDTHLEAVGGHTATVLTDRPNLNDTELIAWLPTMSHEPWDEARNAWRNAGWMALMHPGVGLALADWLDHHAAMADRLASLVDGAPDGSDHPALAVARQLLGTSEAEGERLAQSGVLTPGCDCDHDGMGPAWHLKACTWLKAAAPPAPVDRAAILREAWDVAHEEGGRLEEVAGIEAARGARCVAYRLRRLADEAAAGVQQPIQLRWGLDDVMYGDDDTTTVLLSGPGGEPYWVELDPERTAALRDALAGIAGAGGLAVAPCGRSDAMSTPCSAGDHCCRGAAEEMT